MTKCWLQMMWHNFIRMVVLSSLEERTILLIVEELLKSLITVPFAITSIPDLKLGQAVVLLLEEGMNTDMLKEKIHSVLPKYQCPRQILVISHLPLTGSGKIDRANCRLFAEKMVQI